MSYPTGTSIIIGMWGLGNGLIILLLVFKCFLFKGYVLMSEIHCWAQWSYSIWISAKKPDICGSKQTLLWWGFDEVIVLQPRSLQQIARTLDSGEASWLLLSECFSKSPWQEPAPSPFCSRHPVTLPRNGAPVNGSSGWPLRKRVPRWRDTSKDTWWVPEQGFQLKALGDQKPCTLNFASLSWVVGSSNFLPGPTLSSMIPGGGLSSPTLEHKIPHLVVQESSESPVVS